MSISDSEQYDLLDQLAEEFAARFRRGERPALKEYTDRYPELAEEIRDLFPAMVKVERAEGLRQGEERRAADSRAANPPSTRSATTGSSARSATAAWAWCTRPSRSRSAVGWRSKMLPRHDRRRPQDARAIPPRGPRRGATASHQHRAGVRGRPRGGCLLLRHAVHSGPGARPGLRRDPQAAGPAEGRGSVAVPGRPGCRSNGSGPRPRTRPALRPTRSPSDPASARWSTRS